MVATAVLDVSSDDISKTPLKGRIDLIEDLRVGELISGVIVGEISVAISVVPSSAPEDKRRTPEDSGGTSELEEGVNATHDAVDSETKDERRMVSVID